MVMITLLNLKKRFSCLERGGGLLYKVLPQQEKIVDKTQRLLVELRSYINIVSFGSNLHFATFIGSTHII